MKLLLFLSLDCDGHSAAGSRPCSSGSGRVVCFHGNPVLLPTGPEAAAGGNGGVAGAAQGREDGAGGGAGEETPGRHTQHDGRVPQTGTTRPL